jgi:hypothetical protein
MKDQLPQTGSRPTPSAFRPRSNAARRLGVGLLALSSIGVATAAAGCGSDSTGSASAQSSSAGAPSSPSPSSEAQETPNDEVQKRKAYDRFFFEGYDLADAEKLAKIWQIDPEDAKIKAGQKLLDAGPGSTLITDGDNIGDVIKGEGPGPAPSASDDAGGAGDTEAQKRKAYQEFLSEGYDLADAQKLAKIWQIDPEDAKIKAGQKLLDGVALPIKP